MAKDIQNIDGVVSVGIKRVGDVLEFDVAIKSLDFDLFEKVAQKELDLFEEQPDQKAYFNIRLAS